MAHEIARKPKDPPSTKPAQKPLVAKISLWTTRKNHDSGNSSDDDDDSGDDLDLEIDENAQLEQRLKQANLPDYVRKVTSKELQKLRRTPNFMSDYAITRSYLELIADLPWNEETMEIIDLKKCRKDLDNDHYGMDKLKDRVLQYLAVRKLKQGTQGRQAQPILMFVGPPGTGKTSIAHSIANSLGRKFQRISLGGVADQSAIRGHRRTYIGAMPGRIIQGIKSVGVNNPVFLLDEVDKMTASSQGDPAGALLEVLDPEQNCTFTDHYLNIAFDLSKVLFIATANYLWDIPNALLDRMEVIRINGYTYEEKFSIAKRHLIPKQLAENGIKPDMLLIKDDAIKKIIAHYVYEAGVRSLERKLGTICRVVAVKIVESQTQQSKVESHSAKVDFPIIVEEANLSDFLGPIIYERESNSRRATVPGVAIGMAWTYGGGALMVAEVEIIEGHKDLVLTGQLGSVMRESATLALTWVRANCHLYEALPSTLAKDIAVKTVHIHFPAGAVSKDGPSAGVTIITALMSLCADMTIEPDMAMTGEVTLRGVVLKVGGVKEKVMAAHRAGIKRIILPAKNEACLDDVPASVRDEIKFHFVRTIEEVIKIAFNGRLTKSHKASTDLSFKL